jgi:cytoskeleton protein RodZ
MSENWTVEAVADSKPEAPPEKPPEAAVPAIPSVLSSDHSLGEIMTMAREARAFSREQAAKASNIPGYYLTMIETDDYSSIADQLYLLPFLRRYATFVGLEPEEVASRFIRDVQRADMNPGRATEPIPIFVKRKGFPWRIALTAGVIAIGVVGWFGYRHFVARKFSTANSKAPVSTEQVAPSSSEVAPNPDDAAPEETVPVPMAAPSAIAPAASPVAVLSPAAMASAAIAPVAASTQRISAPKQAAHSAAASSTGSSRSAGAHPRGLKPGASSHRMSMQN